MNNGSVNNQERLVSLDALRGFDMFWIAGGEWLVATLAAYTSWPVFLWAHRQMEHVAWNGFHFYDMIFPLFLFIAGISMPFSLGKRQQRGDSSRSIYLHLFTRLFLLVLLGAIYNGLLRFDFEHQRYASVLARIGFGGFFAAIIFLNTKPKAQAIWFAGILLGYWAILKLIPVPGIGAGVLTQEGSLAGYIDRMLCPGALYLGNHDPEGILSTIPAVATALLGALTGQLLSGRIRKMKPLHTGLTILAAGVICLVVGRVWDVVFPINKNLWTSSFVLYAGGWSLVFVSIFYLIIDVWGFKKWAFPFVVIGLNSITVYMLNSGILSFDQMGRYFFSGVAGLFSQAFQPVIISAAAVLCMWLVLYVLYRYKIFLKV
jgi:predicted acyltransferase